MSHQNKSQQATQPSVLQRELALDKAINARMAELVRLANITVLLLEKSNLKENQLRNVVNVAGSVESVEELLNFIRYQIAREKAWRDKHVRSDIRGFAQDSGLSPQYGDLDFGHQVIADIQANVCTAAKQAVANARQRLGNVPEDEILRFDTAYRRLADQYLGYLNRAFYYCTKTDKGFDKLAAMVQIKECAHAQA